MTELQRQFGQRLRQIRLMRQITQQDLANRTRLSVGYISNLERGISAPSFGAIEVLANILEVEVVDLFDFAAKTMEQRKRGRHHQG